MSDAPECGVAELCRFGRQLPESPSQDLGVAGSRCCRLNWLPRIVCLFHARVIIPHQYCYYVPPALSLVLSYCVDCPEVNGGGEIVYL